MKLAAVFLLLLAYNSVRSQKISSQDLNDYDSLSTYCSDTPYFYSYNIFIKKLTSVPEAVRSVRLDDKNLYQKGHCADSGTKYWLMQLLDTLSVRSYGWPFLINPSIDEIPIPDPDSIRTFLLRMQAFENCFNALIARVKKDSLVQFIWVGTYDYMGEGISRKSATWLLWNASLNSWDMIDLNYEVAFYSGTHVINYEWLSHYVRNPRTGYYDRSMDYNCLDNDFVLKYLEMLSIKAPMD